MRFAWSNVRCPRSTCIGIGGGLAFSAAGRKFSAVCQLELEGSRSNRDAIAARVRVSAGDLAMVREVDGGNGFSAQSAQTLHFGLNKHMQADLVEIRWPSGARQTHRNVPGDSKLSIREPR